LGTPLVFDATHGIIIITGLLNFVIFTILVVVAYKVVIMVIAIVLATRPIAICAKSDETAIIVETARQCRKPIFVLTVATFVPTASRF